MELIIPLDPQGKRPLYEQIYRHIKTEIRNGNFKAPDAPSLHQAAGGKPKGEPQHDAASL